MIVHVPHMYSFGSLRLGKRFFNSRTCQRAAQEFSNRSMIDLGLARTYSLLSALGSPQNYFNAFHVAGTNGKGSVVSYLSSILVQSNIRTGKFTSPHLFRPNDGICIDNVPISYDKYSEVREYVENIDRKHRIGATEFEIQTVIAFEVFRREQVGMAVIEVGLGGLLDATNTLRSKNVFCTGICKISLDHESFLGDDIQSIATQKAGIIKYGVPCVVDGSNPKEVIRVIRRCAEDQSAPVYLVNDIPKEVKALIDPTRDLLQGDFQIYNAAVASKMAELINIPAATIAEGLRSTKWRGRLEWVEYKGSKILVDGAHNTDAARELRKYVDKHLTGPITWVVAFSKPCDNILPLLVRSGDKVICSSFGDVEGMPWIHAQPIDDIEKVAKKLTQDVSRMQSISQGALEHEKNVVVCGSLYLLRDVL